MTEGAKTSEDNHLLNGALKLASIGWAIHPLHTPIFEGDAVRCTCKAGADCKYIGKHPRLTGWQAEATTDELRIREWWRRWPDANIGVPCGPVSGLVLVDLDADTAKGAIDTYAEKHNIESARDDIDTTTAKTGRGGHLVFGWTAGCEQLSNYVKVIDGLDIRTDGGQFVAPPSHHFTGKTYEWLKPPWDVPPKPLPGWLLTFLLEAKAKAKAKAKNKATLDNNAAKLEEMKVTGQRKRATGRNEDGAREKAYAEAALTDELAILRATHTGRNDQLNRSAFSLGGFVGAGLLNRARVVSELEAAAEHIELKGDEIKKTIASGMDAGERNPRSIPEDESEPTGPGPDEGADILELLASLPERAKEDVGAPYDPEVLGLLATLRDRDPASWARIRAKLKAVDGVSVSELDRITTKIIKERQGQKSGAESKQSTATRLVDLVFGSGAELWHSPDGEPFITIQVNGHREHHPTKNKTVRRWLSQILHTAEGKTPYGQAIRDALTVLEGRAGFDGAEYPVSVRLAEHEKDIYLDMGNDGWEAIRISPKGWEIVPSEKVPVRFRRPKGLLPLPYPVRGGDLETLRSVVNVPPGDPWILAVAWLLQAFRPTGPYPILITNGEQGSAKSALGRTLRSLIDPNVAPLRRPPRNEQDLMIAAVNGWMVSYDNLSGLPPWLSDALCVLSTGGGLAGRELYSDSEEVLLDAQRPVMVNGIDEMSTRGDILDRAIVLTLPRIEEADRRTEKELYSTFVTIRPGVLGALLDVVVCGLANLPNVRLEILPRMADFAEWVVACEGALSWENGAFIDAYNKNRSEAISSIIDSDRFALAVFNFASGMEEPYDGAAALVLSALETRVGVDPRYPPDGWPRTPRGLTSKLKRIAPGLRAVGIGVEFLPRQKNRRLIRLWNIDDSNGERQPGDGGDGGDGTKHARSKEHKDGNINPVTVGVTVGDGTKSNRHPFSAPPDSEGDGGDGGDGTFSSELKRKKKERGKREEREGIRKEGFSKERVSTVTTVTTVTPAPADSGLEGDGTKSNRHHTVTNRHPPNQIDKEIAEGEAREAETKEHFNEASMKAQPTIEEAEGVDGTKGAELEAVVEAAISERIKARPGTPINLSAMVRSCGGKPPTGETRIDRRARLQKIETVVVAQLEAMGYQRRGRHGDVVYVPAGGGETHQVKPLAFELEILKAMDGAEKTTVGDLSTRTGWDIDLCLLRLNILVEQRGWSKANGTYAPPKEAAR